MTEIRLYLPSDYPEWCRMRTALWPDQSESDMAAWLARAAAAVLVAERSAASLGGFLEVGERAWAEGCATGPVAYVEGWWVDPDLRERGVGTKLVHAAETWARERGLSELASDVALDNTVSQRAHERLGFEEVERAVLYRKVL